MLDKWRKDTMYGVYDRVQAMLYGEKSLTSKNTMRKNFHD